MTGGSPPQPVNDEQPPDAHLVTALYVEHLDELRAFLLGVLRDGELVSEALQATCLKAMEFGHNAREESRKGWLFRVAYHQALELKRKEKRHDVAIRKAARTSSNPEHQETQTPADHLTRWETVETVRQAMQTLPEEQRIVVTLRIYEEKTFAIIAEELGVPLGTVLTRMRLALKKLERQLQDRD